MMPSGHKAFLVSNVNDVELLLMHNKTYAAEYVPPRTRSETTPSPMKEEMYNKTKTNMASRIAHNVSSRKRVDIIARAKQLGVKVTNAKAKVTTEV